MSDKPLLGRCKDCDFALFATDAQVTPADSFREMRPGVPYLFDGTHFAKCFNGHRVFVLNRIQGTYSKVHKCDSRCLNARGHTCTCSCGGMNHGRGFAITLQIDASREPQFVGEVGRFITGYVTVVGLRSIRANADTTLVTFATDKGDILKWFAPSYLVTFDQGDRFKIRARVKSHDDNQYGKATMITYVERIEE